MAKSEIAAPASLRDALEIVMLIVLVCGVVGAVGLFFADVRATRTALAALDPNAVITHFHAK